MTNNLKSIQTLCKVINISSGLNLYRRTWDYVIRSSAVSSYDPCNLYPEFVLTEASFYRVLDETRRSSLYGAAMQIHFKFEYIIMRRELSIARKKGCRPMNSPV